MISEIRGTRESCAHQSLFSESSVAWWLEDHDGAVDMDERDGGDAAKFAAQCLGLCDNNVSVFIAIACVDGKWAALICMRPRVGELD